MRTICFISAINTDLEYSEIWLNNIQNLSAISRSIRVLCEILNEHDIFVVTDSQKLINLLKNEHSKINRLYVNSYEKNHQSLIKINVETTAADVVILINPKYPLINSSTLSNSISKLNNTCDIVCGVDYHCSTLNIPSPYSFQNNVGIGFITFHAKSIDKVIKQTFHPDCFVSMNQSESMLLLNETDLKFINHHACILDEDKTKIFKSVIKENIKLLVLDVDGVMTDGGMYYSESGDEFKKFNTKDGMAIKSIDKKGIHVGFLSSGINKKLITNRAKLLGVKYCHVGLEKKTDILKEWVLDLNIDYKHVAYIGDDVNDIEVMKVCGFTACPNDAVDAIKNIADITLSRNGGMGCVREFIDAFILG